MSFLRAVLLAVLPGLLFAQPQSGQTTVPAVPLAALYKVYDGQGQVRTTMTRMIAANGSLREGLGEQGERQLSILNTDKLTEISLNSQLGIHTAAPMLPQRAARLKSMPSGCEEFFRPIPGFRSVTCYETGQERYGYPVVRIVSFIEAFGNGTVKEEVTAIRELGWLILSRANYGPKGNLARRYELSELKLGEPPAELFSPPAGSRWVPLLDFHLASSQASGIPMPPEERALWQRKMEILEEDSKKTGNFNWKK